MKSFYNGCVWLFLLLVEMGIFSTATSDICGESRIRATDDTQELTSPNYPSEYPKNTTCSWTISSPYFHSDIYIKIKYLDLEESSYCEKDSLTIYQHYRGREMVVKLCGNETSNETLELGRDVNIVLETDNDVEGTGFVLQYYMVDDDSHERDGYHTEGYSDNWFIAVLVVVILLLVAFAITLSVTCFCQRRQSRADKLSNIEDIQDSGSVSKEDLYKSHI